MSYMKNDAYTGDISYPLTLTPPLRISATLKETIGGNVYLSITYLYKAP